jgi:hypothetical protein
MIKEQKNQGSLKGTESKYQERKEQIGWIAITGGCRKREPSLYIEAQMVIRKKRVVKSTRQVSHSSSLA